MLFKPKDINDISKCSFVPTITESEEKTQPKRKLEQSPSKQPTKIAKRRRESPTYYYFVLSDVFIINCLLLVRQVTGQVMLPICPFLFGVKKPNLTSTKLFSHPRNQLAILRSRIFMIPPILSLERRAYSLPR